MRKKLLLHYFTSMIYAYVLHIFYLPKTLRNISKGLLMLLA